jgi:hypothetical protein
MTGVGKVIVTPAPSESTIIGLTIGPKHTEMLRNPQQNSQSVENHANVNIAPTCASDATLARKTCY